MMAYLLINDSFKKNFTPLRPNDIVTEFLEKDKLDSLFLILPTSKLVKYYKSNIIREYYNKHSKPVSRLNIYSINQFIKLCFDKIFANSDKEYRILSEAYNLTLFKEAVENTELKYFSAAYKSSNLLLRLFSIINGLREDGMDYNALFKDLESMAETGAADADNQKLSDLTNIMKSFESLLGDKFLDSISILKWIIAYYQNEYIGLIPDINQKIGSPELIYFWGFTEFKQPETEFVNLFKETDSAIAVHLDYSINDGPLLGKY